MNVWMKFMTYVFKFIFLLQNIFLLLALLDLSTTLSPLLSCLAPGWPPRTRPNHPGSWHSRFPRCWQIRGMGGDSSQTSFLQLPAHYSLSAGAVFPHQNLFCTCSCKIQQLFCPFGPWVSHTGDASSPILASSGGPSTSSVDFPQYCRAPTPFGCCLSQFPARTQMNTRPHWPEESSGRKMMTFLFMFWSRISLIVECAWSAGIFGCLGWLTMCFRRFAQNLRPPSWLLKWSHEKLHQWVYDRHNGNLRGRNLTGPAPLHLVRGSLFCALSPGPFSYRGANKNFRTEGLCCTPESFFIYSCSNFVKQR